MSALTRQKSKAGMILLRPQDVERFMTHRQHHGIEKLQVQITAAAVLVAAYFLVWRAVRPADPEGAVTFLATGSFGRGAVLAAVVLLVTVLCAVTTISARPEGTLAAALMGLGGVSVHSGPMRTLLWLRQGDLSSMYWQMAAEVVLLGLVLAVGAGVLRRLGPVGRRLAGKWAWNDLLGAFNEKQQREYVRFVANRKRDDDGEAKGDLSLKPLGGGFARIISDSLDRAAVRRTGLKAPDGEALARWGSCFALCLAAAAALLWLLAQSADRGQILFAVFAGCFLSTMLAYHVFPSRCSSPAWAAAVVLGAGSYVLAAVNAATFQSGPATWVDVPACFQALPVDWLTAGAGGALLGYWVSSRMHESKFLEYHEEQEEGGT
jgi:hypothetical protein